MSWKRLLIASILLIGAAVSAYFYLRQRPQTAQATAPAAVEAPAEISLPGTVRARNVVLVPATADGTLETVAVENGDQVYEGQVLAHIKNTASDSAREQAAAELERAQERYNRLESAVIEGRLEASRAGADASRASGQRDRTEKAYQRQQLLFREGAGSRLAFEKAEREYAAAVKEHESLAAVADEVQKRVDSQGQQVDVMRRMLAEKRQALEDVDNEVKAGDVLSPATGTVVGKRGDPGSEVSREMRDLFQIAVDLSALDAVVEPPPHHAKLIRAGQPALVLFVELGNEAIPGTVREVKDDRAVVGFVSPNAAINPGDKVQVRIQIDSSGAAIP